MVMAAVLAESRNTVSAQLVRNPLMQQHCHRRSREVIDQRFPASHRYRLSTPVGIVAFHSQALSLRTNKAVSGLTVTNAGNGNAIPHD